MWCLDLWSPYIPLCVYYSGVLLSRQRGDSLCVCVLCVFVLQNEQKPQCSLAFQMAATVYLCPFRVGWFHNLQYLTKNLRLLSRCTHSFSTVTALASWLTSQRGRKQHSANLHCAAFSLNVALCSHLNIPVTVSGGTIRASWWASRRNEGMRSCFRSADTELPALCILMISQHINKPSI